MSNINNKIIWITGASSGIGEALAYELSTRNCKLILSARNEEALKKIKANCNSSNVEILPFNLTDYENSKNNVLKAISFFGRIDILINNGGISQRSLITETNFEVNRKLIDVNYLGVVSISTSLLPHFIKHQQGHFVTISSLMGKFSSPLRSGYCASKHALHGFFDSLRMEHQKDNIKVTLICPGFVKTNISKNALTGNGTAQNSTDEATEKGISVELFAKKLVKSIEKDKFESYIGGKEVLGIYLKRFFPKLLHKFVLRSKIR